MSCYSRVTYIILKTTTEKYFFFETELSSARSLFPKSTENLAHTTISGTTQLSSADLKNQKIKRPA